MFAVCLLLCWFSWADFFVGSRIDWEMSSMADLEPQEAKRVGRPFFLFHSLFLSSFSFILSLRRESERECTCSVFFFGRPSAHYGMRCQKKPVKLGNPVASRPNRPRTKKKGNAILYAIRSQLPRQCSGNEFRVSDEGKQRDTGGENRGPKRRRIKRERERERENSPKNSFCTPRMETERREVLSGPKKKSKKEAHIHTLTERDVDLVGLSCRTTKEEKRKKREEGTEKLGETNEWTNEWRFSSALGGGGFFVAFLLSFPYLFFWRYFLIVPWWPRRRADCSPSETTADDAATGRHWAVVGPAQAVHCRTVLGGSHICTGLFVRPRALPKPHCHPVITPLSPYSIQENAVKSE